MCQMASIDFPAWLEKQLSDRGWRSTELANKSGLTDAAISRILRGMRQPSPESLTAIAKALRLNPKVVFEAAGQFPEDPNVDKWVEAMDHKINLIKDPSRRKMIESVIDSMVEDEEKEQAGQHKPRTRPAGT